MPFRQTSLQLHQWTSSEHTYLLTSSKIRFLFYLHLIFLFLCTIFPLLHMYLKLHLSINIQKWTLLSTSVDVDVDVDRRIHTPSKTLGSTEDMQNLQRAWSFCSTLSTSGRCFICNSDQHRASWHNRNPTNTQVKRKIQFDLHSGMKVVQRTIIKLKPKSGSTKTIRFKKKKIKRRRRGTGK